MVKILHSMCDTVLTRIHALYESCKYTSDTFIIEQSVGEKCLQTRASVRVNKGKQRTCTEHSAE